MTFLTDTRATLARQNKGFGLSRALDVWRQRQHLKALDDQALSDIGVSRAQAQREATRPIWDVPETWRC